MASNRVFLTFAVVWVLLALATLALVVQNGTSLTAALVAWCGGVVTYPLAVEVWNRTHR